MPTFTWPEIVLPAKHPTRAVTQPQAADIPEAAGATPPGVIGGEYAGILQSLCLALTRRRTKANARRGCLTERSGTSVMISAPLMNENLQDAGFLSSCRLVVLLQHEVGCK